VVCGRTRLMRSLGPALGVDGMPSVSQYMSRAAQIEHAHQRAQEQLISSHDIAAHVVREGLGVARHRSSSGMVSRLIGCNNAPLFVAGSKRSRPTQKCLVDCVIKTHAGGTTTIERTCSHGNCVCDDAFIPNNGWEGNGREIGACAGTFTYTSVGDLWGT
jgi:hypothetical protein